MRHPAPSLSKNALQPDRSPRAAFYPSTQKDRFDPTRTKRQPVKYWAGPLWSVEPSGLVLIHPGQPRPRALVSEVEDKRAETARPVADHEAQTAATSTSDMSTTETSVPEKPRKRRHATPKAQAEPVPLESRRWLTIKETARRYPYSEGSLRHLVFQAEQYAKYPKSGLKSNGFLHCIVRPEGARRVLIDAEKFELWLQGQ